MDPLIRNRLIAGAGVLVAFGIGMSTVSDTTAAMEDKVAMVRARETSPEQAQAEALAREHKYKRTDDYFAEKLAEDLKSYGLTGVDVETLRQPNAFDHPISEPKALSPGASFESKHLRVSAVIEKVTYRRQGATVSARHAIAKVTNKSDVPVAYFIDVRSSDRGECKVRGARTHNAMSLLPGETADIAVCAGSGGVEILDLRVLEVSPVGHMYVSRLPPQTVGYDAVNARSHAAGRGAEMCSSVPSVKLATLIRDKRRAWEDVVDFYSRHNCDRIQYVDGYVRATEPLSTLPVVAAQEG